MVLQNGQDLHEPVTIQTYMKSDIRNDDWTLGLLRVGQTSRQLSPKNANRPLNLPINFIQEKQWKDESISLIAAMLQGDNKVTWAKIECQDIEAQ